jgi:hypothetical protein
MLFIGGGSDHTVPWSITHASFKQQQRNADVTEITKIEGRGHALTIDSGWREVTPPPAGKEHPWISTSQARSPLSPAQARASD